MGARLVSSALHPYWAQLSHLQHRVLVVMAQTALDLPGRGHQRAVYWAGRDYIALCIYGTDKPTRAQLDTIQRAQSSLIDLGAIERIDAANGRRRARFKITLDAFNQPPLPEE